MGQTERDLQNGLGQTKEVDGEQFKAYCHNDDCVVIGCTLIVYEDIAGEAPVIKCHVCSRPMQLQRKGS